MKRWKRAIVTGAAEGIGKALTKQLLSEGVEVIAFDKEPLVWFDKNTHKTLKMININLINSNSVNDVILHLERFGKYDLVIHNAGISATGKFEEINPRAYENLIRLNTLLPMQLTAVMAQNDLYTEDANLVFISSLSHVTGYPGASVYGASKDAIAIYAKSIRRSFAKMGIKVTTVFPGPVKTNHAQRHAPKDAKAESRMEPDILARKILASAGRGARVLYPGSLAKIVRIAGAIAPGFMTKTMRQIIYEKLDKPVW